MIIVIPPLIHLGNSDSELVGANDVGAGDKHCGYREIA